jgi:hypothetical protein
MQPLAENLRPQTLEVFFGQSHLLSDAHPLRQAIDNKYHSPVSTDVHHSTNATAQRTPLKFVVLNFQLKVA